LAFIEQQGACANEPWQTTGGRGGLGSRLTFLRPHVLGSADSPSHLTVREPGTDYPLNTTSEAQTEKFDCINESQLKVTTNSVQKGNE